MSGVRFISDADMSAEWLLPFILSLRTHPSFKYGSRLLSVSKLPGLPWLGLVAKNDLQLPADALPL
jgi:hypothetical protein